jgi:hypothetical protein
VTGHRRVDATGRSTGRYVTKRRNKIEGQFAAHLIEMLESPAWRVLSVSGRRVLDRLEIELARHAGTENGRLPCTYEDFIKYGMDRHAIAPAIREVVALGFAEITVKGYGGRQAECRQPNLFRLTYPCGPGDPPTHEWRRIETIEEAKKIATDARGPSRPNSGKRKPKSRCGVAPNFGVGNPHQKTELSGRETHTTDPPLETPTTSISRVGIDVRVHQLGSSDVS